MVLIGYDDENLYFMDPSTGRHYAYIPRGEFVDRWHDVEGPANTHRQHMVVRVRPRDASLSPYSGATIPSTTSRIY